MFSPKPNSALIVVGHGSTVNPDSSAPTFEHAEEILRRGVFGEVHCAFWKEEPSLRQVLHMVERDDVYVAPNFISEGYFTRTIIPRELELAGAVTRENGRTIKYCEPVGSHPRMTELLLRRAAEIAPGVPPAETSLLIVGHGTGLNDQSAVAAKREVERIRALGRYAEVFSAYMEEEPLISRWNEFAGQRHVVVVPFFVSDGLHSYEDIPVLLGIAEESGGAASTNQNSIFRNNPYRRHGRLLYYASAIGTEPLFAELILEQVAAFDAQFWRGRRKVMRDLLAELAAWVQAGGNEVGEIVLRKLPAGGFELRHQEDAVRDGLDFFDRPEAARELASYDDAGRFRPLKTAPNLRHGWRLALKDLPALRRALDYFYPAMLGVWCSHRRGELQPVPLRETLGRQSGMYRVTQKLTDEQAQTLVGGFCRTESGCLKRILWPLAPGQPIASLPPSKFSVPDPPAFPLLCHEACNLLVAKAREVVKQGEPQP